MLNTPVAFIIFNRPKQTELVFQEIARARPKKLLVVADGPRFPEEAAKCEQTRAIIEKVDWDCEVLTNFSEINLGCKNRVSSGIDWVFTQVEEAIILEDDCLPNPTFFRFCQELLDRYRDDPRIMHISGDNFQFGRSRTKYSYFFSKYFHVWGWATWRRAWKYYDVGMKTWPRVKETNQFGEYFETRLERKFWEATFEKVYHNQMDTWDYQWAYACWYYHGLSVIPEKNLVTNIGFGEDSTHLKTFNKFADLPTFEIPSLLHPPYVERNSKADRFTSKTSFQGSFVKYLIKTRFNFIYRLIKKFR